jgi:hypothetical protein
VSPARPGPRRHISTLEILEAVATRGRFWTAVFADDEVRTVNEAVDRELLAGTLLDACTLTTFGSTELARLRGKPNDQGRIDVRIDHACREHGPCWIVRCVRCDALELPHVAEDELEETVQKVLADHVCLGTD